MNIYFHIGYPKAGSTFLQKSLFARSHNIVNLGLYPTSNAGKDTVFDALKDQPIFNNQNIKYFYKYISCTPVSEYSEVLAKTLFDNLVSQYKAYDLPILFSNESILSARFSLPDIYRKVERVLALSKDIKILVIIRNQYNILRSLYRDFPYDPQLLMSRFQPVSFQKFLKRDMQLKYFSHTESLFFSTLYDLLLSRLPKSSFLFLPLELISVDRSKFCYLLAEFLNLNESHVSTLLDMPNINSGSTYLHFRYRLICPFLNEAISFLPQGQQTKLKSLQSDLESLLLKSGQTCIIDKKHKSLSMIDNFYENSNKKISDIATLNLNNLHYF